MGRLKVDCQIVDRAVRERGISMVICRDEDWLLCHNCHSGFIVNYDLIQFYDEDVLMRVR